MYLIYPSEASFIGFGYGGLGTIGVGGQRNFFSRHMGGGLVYRLMVVGVHDLFIIQTMCYSGRESFF